MTRKTVLIVGATGVLGTAVAEELSKHHEVIRAGYSRGEYRLDATDTSDIERFFQRLGLVDAVISTIGSVSFKPLSEMSASDFAFGWKSKLQSQLNLVLIGSQFVNALGSFTLTSGILSDNPIKGGTSAAAVNSAINGFVRAAACEIGRGVRINAVSANVLDESVDDYETLFPGFGSVPAKKVALAFRRSVDGVETGQTFKVW